MNARVEELLSAQCSLVAHWQLLALPVSPDAARHFAEHSRRVGDGVYLTGHGPITREQRRWAAVLAAPSSFLAFASALSAWGIRTWEGDYEVVVRPGSGGPKRIGDVLVCRSKLLVGHTTTLAGLPITTVERTIVDLGGTVVGRAAHKLVREAIRLQLTTMPRLQRQFHRSRGRRGVAGLRAYAEQFGTLPFARCRSDAEAMGLQVLAEATRPIPDVNFLIAGEEADFSWPTRRLIIEIDGPQFHQFADEDARKTAAWEAIGWTVRRIPSGDVFEQPRRLIALHDRPTFI